VKDYATTLAANRQPEHRVRALVDAEGYVIGGIFETGEQDFIGFMRKNRRRIDPNTIEMRDWPVDEHGRGLTLLELDARTKQERIA
jgi:hypothetical protein